jgi:hypothetical protein
MEMFGLSWRDNDDFVSSDTFTGLLFEVDGITYKFGFDLVKDESFHSCTPRPMISILGDSDTICLGCSDERLEHCGARMRCNLDIDWNGYWKSGRIGNNNLSWDYISDG